MASLPSRGSDQIGIELIPRLLAERERRENEACEAADEADAALEAAEKHRHTAAKDAAEARRAAAAQRLKIGAAINEAFAQLPRNQRGGWLKLHFPQYAASTLG